MKDDYGKEELFYFKYSCCIGHLTHPCAPPGRGFTFALSSNDSLCCQYIGDNQTFIPQMKLSSNYLLLNFKTALQIFMLPAPTKTPPRMVGPASRSALAKAGWVAFLQFVFLKLSITFQMQRK
jgi:hypothetical protein